MAKLASGTDTKSKIGEARRRSGFSIVILLPKTAVVPDDAGEGRVASFSLSSCDACCGRGQKFEGL